MSHENTSARAIAWIKDATDTLRSVKARGNQDTGAFSAAEDDVRRAVYAANDLGVSWQTIGDALGVARGNAYQRYRRKTRIGDV